MGKNTKVYNRGYKCCNICCIGLALISILNLAISNIKNEQWVDVKTYFLNYSLAEAIPEVIGLISIPILIFVVSSLYFSLKKEKKFWGLIIIIISSLAVLTLVISYFMEIAIGFPKLENGIIEEVDMYLFANPNSLVRYLKNLGYFTLTLSFFFLTFALNKSTIESIIKKFALICGIFNLGYIANFFIDNKIIKSGILLCWNVFLPVMLILLSIYFRSKIKLSNKKSVKGKKRNKNIS